MEEYFQSRTRLDSYAVKMALHIHSAELADSISRPIHVICFGGAQLDTTVRVTIY